MNYQDINNLAEKGRMLLEKGQFPSEILETVKDSSARRDVADKIFYPKSGKKLDGRKML